MEPDVPLATRAASDGAGSERMADAPSRVARALPFAADIELCERGDDGARRRATVQRRARSVGYGSMRRFG